MVQLKLSVAFVLAATIASTVALPHGKLQKHGGVSQANQESASPDPLTTRDDSEIFEARNNHHDGHRHGRQPPHSHQQEPSSQGPSTSSQGPPQDGSAQDGQPLQRRSLDEILEARNNHHDGHHHGRQPNGGPHQGQPPHSHQQDPSSQGLAQDGSALDGQPPQRRSLDEILEARNHDIQVHQSYSHHSHHHHHHQHQHDGSLHLHEHDGSPHNDELENDGSPHHDLHQGLPSSTSSQLEDGSAPEDPSQDGVPPVRRRSLDDFDFEAREYYNLD